MFYYLALSLFFTAFTLLVFVLTSVARPNKTVLAEQLKFYEESWRRTYKAPVQPKSGGLSFGSLLRHRFALALERSEARKFIQGALERAGMKTDWSEFALYHITGVAGTVLAVYFLAGLTGAVLIFPVAAAGPVLVLDYLAVRRKTAFEAQLPETFTMLAGSLKAGYSLVQAVDMVSRETGPPISAEFSKAINDARLGLAVEEALDKAAARIGSVSFEWMVLAVKIQREVGGNLAEVLETLAKTIRDRDQVQRQIKVLTAEGRLSAIILLALPFFVSLALFLLNPGYISVLFRTAAGIGLVATALTLMVIGSVWLYRVIKVEV